MSGLTEAEIADKVDQCIKEARDACLWLARNADPTQKRPRGHYYTTLRRALRETEGCCRQFAAFRGDTRWLPLGIICAKAMRAAQKRRVEEDWSGFRDLAKVFDSLLHKIEELKTARVNRLGLILPKQTGWLQMPELKIPRPIVRTVN